MWEKNPQISVYMFKMFLKGYKATDKTGRPWGGVMGNQGQS